MPVQARSRPGACKSIDYPPRDWPGLSGEFCWHNTGFPGQAPFLWLQSAGPGSLQQSPAEGGSFAPASSTTFQLPSGCLRQMVR